MIAACRKQSDDPSGGGKPNWYGTDMWVIGGRLRLCPADGGCGYVSMDAVVQLR